MSHIDLSVIIPARDDSRLLHAIIQEIRTLAPRAEVIVVCHQPSPATREQIQQNDAHLICSDQVFTYDEGRGLGARHATRSVLLFLDDQVVWPGKQLEKYVKHAANGTDLVLTANPNAVSSDSFFSRRMTYLLLNHIVQRKDLGIASLYEAPFALARKAAEQLDLFSDLFSFNPAALLVQGILQKLDLRTIQAPLIRKRGLNRGRKLHSSLQKVMTQHAEAINLWMQEREGRGGLWDGDRYRPLLQVAGNLHLRSVYRSHEWEILQRSGWDGRRRTKKASNDSKQRKRSLVKGKQTASKRDHRGTTRRKNR